MWGTGVVSKWKRERKRRERKEIEKLGGKNKSNYTRIVGTVHRQDSDTVKLLYLW